MGHKMRSQKEVHVKESPGRSVFLLKSEAKVFCENEKIYTMD
jgi:hypothetical protein